MGVRVQSGLHSFLCPDNHSFTIKPHRYRCKNFKSMAKQCPECGYPLNGSESACPECGRLLNQPFKQVEQQYATPQPAFTGAQTTAAPIPVATATERTDWANYIYECGVIVWRSLWQKKFDFTGRASRREFWSFWIIAPWILYAIAALIILPFFFLSILFESEDVMLFALVLGTIVELIVIFIPSLAVCIRRMHDIDKCGWWICVPVACFFLYLKKSDAWKNRYGEPCPASSYLNE